MGIQVRCRMFSIRAGIWCCVVTVVCVDTDMYVSTKGMRPSVFGLLSFDAYADLRREENKNITISASVLV